MLGLVGGIARLNMYLSHINNLMEEVNHWNTLRFNFIAHGGLWEHCSFITFL